MSVSSQDRVRDAAERLGLDIEIRRMDDTTRTAEDAARACGCDVGQIVKSLVFVERGSGALVLLLVSGRNRADIDFIAGRHGLGLDRCDARRVRDETGFAIGGVAPVGHKVALPVYVDRALLAHDIVWCAAGRPDAVFSVEPRLLVAAVNGRVIDVADVRT